MYATLFILPKIAMTVCYLLGSTLFKAFLYYSYEKYHWHFNKDSIQSVDHFKYYGYLNDIHFSNPLTQDFSLYLYLLQFLSDDDRIS